MRTTLAAGGLGWACDCSCSQLCGRASGRCLLPSLGLASAAPNAVHPSPLPCRGGTAEEDNQRRLKGAMAEAVAELVQAFKRSKGKGGWRCDSCGARGRQGLGVDCEPGGRAAIAAAFLGSTQLAAPEEVRSHGSRARAVRALWAPCLPCIAALCPPAAMRCRPSYLPRAAAPSSPAVPLAPCHARPRLRSRAPRVCGCMARLLPAACAPAPAVPALPGGGAERAGARAGCRRGSSTRLSEVAAGC